MPSKSKPSKSDWIQCTACQSTFHVNELSKHTGKCQDCKDPTHLARKLGQDFVRQGVLYTAHVGQVTNENSHLSADLVDCLVHIHVSAMRLCGMCIGQPVIVNGQHIFKAWPSSSNHTTSVGLTKRGQVDIGYKAEDIVSVQNLPAPHLPATEVLLCARDWKSCMDSSSFNTYLLQYLVGKFLCQGNQISIKFYNQPVNLEVVDIKGADREQKVPALSSRDQPMNVISERTTSDTIAQPDTEQGVSKADQIAVGSVTEGLSKLNIQQEMKSEKDTAGKPEDDVTKVTCDECNPDNRDQMQPSAAEKALYSHEDSSSKDRQNYDREKLRTTEFYQICQNTKLVIENKRNPTGRMKSCAAAMESQLSYIGGLGVQLQRMQELIDLALKEPEMLLNQGLTLPRGVLLYGPSGTGKTLLARALAECTGLHHVIVSGPEVWSKFYGETEGRLSTIFKEAQTRAPSLIVLDELEALCPRRDAVQSEMEKRVVAALLTLLDGVNSKAETPVLVIGVTNKPDSIDPALRRPGRLDREIEIGVPSTTDRTDILHKLLSRMSHDLTDDDIISIADRAHGFVGADLAAVCKEAGVHALKRITGSMTAPDSHGSSVCVCKDDLLFGLQATQPSAMREVAIEVPKVSWEDIGGQADLKHKLRQAVEWPLKHPEAFQRLGIRPPRGLLMYGPPGCSKTMIAKALAKESGINFIAIKGPELFSKWVGESERAVREVFRKARAAAPSIIFFDEIDALAAERGGHGSGGSNVGDRVLAQLLTEIDGVEALQDVTILAATNRPDRVDKALLRPGRLDRIIYVPLPDGKTRKEILTIHFKKTPIASDVKIEELVAATVNYSGAEVSAVCHEAALCAMQEDINIESVCNRHFHQALQTVTPRISADTISFYEQYQNISGLHTV